jgi:EAL domain-containing protein (putative c-di-GMP-specific phosphodiesterase class I)
MSAIYRLITTDTCRASVPRYREHPRVDLASGAVAGQAIQLSEGVPAALTLDLACRLASLVAQPVSVQVDGPLTGLTATVAQALARTGIAATWLEIALSGPTLDQAGVECLVALSGVRDLGVDVALRGFGLPGTLEQMQYVPLSAVILDPAQLDGLPEDVDAITRLHRLLDLAGSNGLRVVATGIESEGQRALLSGMGCELGEGSLFGGLAKH